MSVPTAGHFAKEQGARLFRGVGLRITRTLRSPGVDEVHDLRVAIRRFLRILIVLKPCFPHSESRRIRRGLKRIMVQAGSVRDCDIAVRLLEKMALPESGRTAQHFRKQREEAARTLSSSLRRWTERKLAAGWRTALASDSRRERGDDRFRAKPIQSVTGKILPDLADECFSHGRKAAHADASVREMHQFRIAAKNLRYTLDLFVPLFGASLGGLTAHLKEVQTLLGDINDCATVRRLLSRQQETEDTGVKDMRAAIRKRQRRKTEQFRQTFGDAFSGAATLSEWKNTLRQAKPAVKKTPRRASTGKPRPS